MVTLNIQVVYIEMNGKFRLQLINTKYELYKELTIICNHTERINALIIMSAQ
jgi:hypothetical protein